MSTDSKGAHITQYNKFCFKIIYMFCRGQISETRLQTDNHKCAYDISGFTRFACIYVVMGCV